MHGHDRGRALADRCGRRRRVEQAAVLVDVTEDRLGPRMRDRECRCDEGVTRYEDLVAVADPGSHQRERQRGRAGGHADAVVGSAVGGELGLERRDLLAEDEGARAQDAIKRARSSPAIAAC